MIQPVAYKKTLEGKSNAHLITFSDGRDYVVKYNQLGFEKTLANEWIGYCLARFLHLPVPYARLVEIPKEFSSQVPELANMTYTQQQFASLYVPGCYDGHQVKTIKQISNPQSLAAIILFDYWLCNDDRTRKNIILCEEEDSYHLWIIDHAEILGSYNWGLQDLEILPDRIMKSATHQLMAKFVKSEKDFNEALETIQTIPSHLISEIVSVIPEDWNVTDEERKAAVNTLVSRSRKVLPSMLDKFLKTVYQPLHLEERSFTDENP